MKLDHRFVIVSFAFGCTLILGVMIGIHLPNNHDNRQLKDEWISGYQQADWSHVPCHFKVYNNTNIVIVDAYLSPGDNSEYHPKDNGRINLTCG